MCLCLVWGNCFNTKSIILWSSSNLALVQNESLPSVQVPMHVCWCAPYVHTHKISHVYLCHSCCNWSRVDKHHLDIVFAQSLHSMIPKTLMTLKLTLYLVSVAKCACNAQEAWQAWKQSHMRTGLCWASAIRWTSSYAYTSSYASKRLQVVWKCQNNKTAWLAYHTTHTTAWPLSRKLATVLCGNKHLCLLSCTATHMTTQTALYTQELRHASSAAAQLLVPHSSPSSTLLNPTWWWSTRIEVRRLPPLLLTQCW